MRVRVKRYLSFILAICVIACSVSVTGQAAFADLDGHWADKSVRRMQDEGVLTGYEDGSYRPETPVKRGEIAAAFSRLLRLAGGKNAGFLDVPADAWYAEAINSCAENGIIYGSENRMRPLDNISREEFASIVCRALQIPTDGAARLDFSDADQVSPWARDAVAALAERQVLLGHNGKFSPKEPVTRAALAAVLDRAITSYITEPGEYQMPAHEGALVLVFCDGAALRGKTEASIVVAPGAEGGKLKLAETGIVKTLKVMAADFTVLLDDGSEVHEVVFTEGASGSTLAAQRGSTVESVVCSARNTVVHGGGTVKNVMVTASDAVIETVGTKVTVQSGVTGTLAGGKSVAGGESVTTSSNADTGSSGSEGVTSPGNLPDMGSSGGIQEPEEPEGPEEPDGTVIPISIGFTPDAQMPFTTESGLIRVPAQELEFGYYLTVAERAQGDYAASGPVSLQKLDISQSGDYASYFSFRTEQTVTSARVLRGSAQTLLWDSETDGGMISSDGVYYGKFLAPMAERTQQSWALVDGGQTYQLELYNGDQCLQRKSWTVDFSNVTLEKMPLISALWWSKTAQTSRTPSEFSVIDNTRLRNQGANWLSISHRPINKDGQFVGVCWNTPPMMIEKELELTAPSVKDAHDNGFLVIGKTDTMQFNPLVLERLKEEIALWQADPDNYTQEGRTCKAGEEKIFYPELFDPKYYSDEAYAMLDAELYYGKQLDGRSNVPNNGWQAGNYMSCLLNPNWQNWEKYITAAYANAGYDGVFADLFPYIQGQGLLCGCQYCKDAWKTYSTQRFGQERPFPTGNIDPRTTDGREFFQFRLNALYDFIELLQDVGREINPSFVVLLNTNIDNPCVAYCITQGMAQPISELGQFNAKLGTDISGMYLYRAGEAMTRESVLSQYNNTGNLTLDQYRTSLIEAFAGGGGMMLAAKNDALQDVNIDFTEYLRGNNEFYTDTTSAADVAVLYSWRDHTFLQYGTSIKTTEKMTWEKNAARRASAALAEEGVAFDYLFVESEDFTRKLANYRVIVAPQLSLLEDSHAAALKAYVENGGKLLVLGELGTLRIADNGLDYVARDRNLLEEWTNKTVSDTGWLQTELGSGRIAACAKAVSGPQDNVTVEPGFRCAAEYLALNGQLKVQTEDSAGNGQIETSLRAVADGSKLHLHLIRYGYGADGLSSQRGASATLRLPAGKTAVAVRAVSAFGAQVQPHWTIENDILNVTFSDLGLYAVLEITLADGPNIIPTPDPTPDPVPEPGKDPDTDPDLPPLKVSGAMILGTGKSIRVSFGSDHVRVGTSGIQYAIGSAGKIPEDGWTDFDGLQSGWRDDGGTGYAQYAWDAQITISNITLAEGQALYLRVYADRVAERVKTDDGSIADGQRVMAEDAYVKFTSTDLKTNGELLPAPLNASLKGEESITPDPDPAEGTGENPGTDSDQLPLEVSGVTILEAGNGIRVSFGTDHVHIGTGGIQYAIGFAGKIPEEDWTDFDVLLSGWGEDGGTGFSENAWDAQIAIGNIALAEGEAFYIRVCADLVTELVKTVDGGIVEGQRTMAGDAYAAFPSIGPNTAGRLLPADLEAAPEDGENSILAPDPNPDPALEPGRSPDADPDQPPLEVSGATILETGNGIRVSFGLDHVYIGTHGIQYAISSSGEIPEEGWTDFDILLSGWSEDGGTGINRNAWDAQIAAGSITPAEGESLYIRVCADLVAELVETVDGGVIFGQRVMAKDAYVKFASTELNTEGELLFVE